MKWNKHGGGTSMGLGRLKKLLSFPKLRINSVVLDEEQLTINEKERYQKYSWDFNCALNKLNATLRSLGWETYREEEGISRHQILFSAISNHHQVDHILEIGTSTGESTFLLSHLFPEAKILTVDLPETDAVFRNYSGMKGNDEKLSEYRKIRDSNLSGRNIKFVQCNSFSLPAITGDKFDLIWVDGCHFFPEVSWDICNAYHYCNVGGHILVDDVLEKGVHKKTDKVSSDPRVMLENLKDRSGIDVDFFLKRTDRRSLSDQTTLKYLGVIRKC
jgi:hypothetical protein